MTIDSGVGNVGTMGVITAAIPRGVSHSTLLQKQISYKVAVGANQKADEIEIMETELIDSTMAHYKKNTALGWMCCTPCLWLRTSATVHKLAITTATLLVTSLLVASPILFLISTAPSQLPRNCYNDREGCVSAAVLPPECLDTSCKMATLSINSKLNWNSDPCVDFKNFSCSSTSNFKNLTRIFRSAQESVDLLMQQLLQHNTTWGPFRKLGRLFGSCVRQKTVSSTIRLTWEKLGGYLPVRTLGPSNISYLISRINELGPTPLFDIYYDLSYGKRPHALLIISSPSTESPILQSKLRWVGPKAPPYRIKQGTPKLLNDLLDSFLPSGLTQEQKISEKEIISTFINDLNKILVEHSRRGFWDSSVLYNISSLQKMHPILNWESLIPGNWSGPIVVRSSDYFKAVKEFLTKHPTRVAHNSMLVLFVLRILPKGSPDPVVCTQATMWALPDIASALYIAQHSSIDITGLIKRTEVIFKSLKAHLKRAPSLKGAALVKLSALKIQSDTWSEFKNITGILKSLDSIEITSDNWVENILNIYKRNKAVPNITDIHSDSHDAWAYPIVAKIFYDTLSHSIVVPLSVILVPYFDARLPSYLQYASVGIALAKEILRSITKSFEDKAIQCVPKSVNIFSNYSRMDILIHSGGMQISYHSMLSLTRPMKGMDRLPGLNLTANQIFFLVSAQELCAESDYNGIDTGAPEFEHILGWLIAQGGSATDVFKCPSGSMIDIQKTCNVL